MLPHERSLVEKWKNEPFAVVGVNTDPPETLSKLVKDGTVTWRNFRDEKVGGEISGKWEIVGWPTVYVLDHKGVIRHVDLRGRDLDLALGKLIKEAKEEAGGGKLERESKSNKQ
ncbi:MAG: redoxin domain-containing protein [Akkermansiaceae bacterium]|nr:redoxin domain-containing protein [Akkermansiaceae bacterium]